MCSKPSRAQIASRESERLSPIQAWKLRRHCRACPECREEQTQMRQIETGLQNLAREATPPHVYAALMARLPELSGAEMPQTFHEDVVLDRNGDMGRRQRRRIWAMTVSAALVVAVCGPRLVYNLQHALFVYLTGPQIRTPSVVPSGAATPAAFRPEDSAKFRVKAYQLRLLWKPWAMQHKSELRQMLIVDRFSQSESLQKVWDALPGVLPKEGAGLTLQFLSADECMFTWEPITKLRGASTNRFRGGFTNHPDIRLAHSLNRGFTEYSLWASGRIIEDTAVAQPKPGGHGTMYVSRTREIAPPYEELASKK